VKQRLSHSRRTLLNYLHEFGLTPSLREPHPYIHPAIRKPRRFTPEGRLLDTIYTYRTITKKEYLNNSNKTAPLQVAVSGRNIFPQENGLRQAQVNLGVRVSRYDEKLGQRLIDCGTVLFKMRPDCDHEQEHHIYRARHCGHRLCFTCCKRRAEKLFFHFKPVLDDYVKKNNLHTYFFTFTKKDTRYLPDPALLKKWYRNLWNSKFWKEPIFDPDPASPYYEEVDKDDVKPFVLDGWIKSRDVIIGENSGIWHVHDHAMVITENPIPLIRRGKHKGEAQNYVNQALSDEWRRITGNDSYIVKIKKFDGNYFELFKYLTKSTGEMTDAQLAEFVRWQKNQRFLSYGGSLKTNPVLVDALRHADDLDEINKSEIPSCPVCGKPFSIWDYGKWNFSTGQYDYLFSEKVSFNDSS
jgi:hypothetical protein